MRRAFAGAVLAWAAFAGSALAGPQSYYLVAPEPLAGDLAVMSLEPNNVITAGLSKITLGIHETGVLKGADLSTGLLVSGTGRFTISSAQNAADLLVPSSFAGTSFVIPHIAGTHTYYVLNTAAVVANVTVTLGANSSSLQLNPGVAVAVSGGSDNAIAGRVTSDQPIVMSHIAEVSGTFRDAYPVPPAATTVIGIRSQNAVIGALQNGTSVSVYSSDGTSAVYSLNAGEKVAVGVGSSGAQGQGAAITVVATQPVGAVQYDDGDGSDATAFWPLTAAGTRQGVPLSAQYLAVACTTAGVSLTLYQGAAAPVAGNCSGSTTYPGKAYFGAATNGANIAAGAYLIASAPVYTTYEIATSDDEAHQSGFSPAAGPAAPSLSSVASPTTSNPLAVSGTGAPANGTVHLYANGKRQLTVTANASGAFSFNAELLDGNNVLYATAVSGSDESVPSNVVQVTYNNTISRTQSGTISGTVVWTPGSPVVPYTITANLTIAAGAKLVLQPGTQLKLGSGVVLTATGNLKVAGTASSPVSFTCTAATPTRGCWYGITISSGTSGHEIAYASIQWASTGVNIDGGDAVVRNSTITNFLNNGVYAKITTSLTRIVENVINNGNDTGDCIETYHGHPFIESNLLTNCQKGVNVNRNSSPKVSANTIVSNTYGIYVDGVSSFTPNPTITGNRIYSNSTNDLQTVAFASGAANVKLNATNNWWGTSEAYLIADHIHDLTDSVAAANLPVVDYSGYRLSPEGPIATGNWLNGPLPAGTTTLLSGSTYDVLGTVFVSSGKSLVVQPGAVVRVHPANALIQVDGTIQVAGAAGTPAVFTSGRSTPVRGAWDGIWVRSGAASATFSYALLEWGTTLIKLDGKAGTVSNSTLRNFDASPGTGIHVIGGGAAASVIQNNVIDNGNDSGRCIWVQSTSSTITGNTLTNCDRGIYVLYTATPTVTANIITSNDYGLYVAGNAGGTSYTPQPAVTGNQIFGNVQSNFYTTGFASGAQNIKLNATGNWWGSIDPETIAATINDLTDSYTATTLPTVDYSGFLNGPNGSVVSGNYLIGPFSAAATTLAAGATYDVLGVLILPAAKSLTVGAGTRLRFHGPDARLVVDGALTVQGTAGNLAQLTSGAAAPARGDWPGILVRSGSTTLIEYALIEWAETGVTFDGVAGTVRNSTIRNFASVPGAGIYVKGAGASATLIQGNLIDNLNDSGHCVWAQSSAPTITGNTLTNCDRGVYALYTANPSVTGNIITGNDYGVYVAGSAGGTTYTPQPVVTGNQIFANDTTNFYTFGYASGAQNVKLNATGNWWGSTVPSTIAAKITDLTDSYTSLTLPTVDYSGFLDGPNGAAVPGNQLIGVLSAATTTLDPNTTYDVLGVLFVPTTKTLALGPGTRLRFHGAATRLVVDGTLNVQGAVGNPAILTSGQAAPARGDWVGVMVRAGTGTALDYARVEWAETAIALDGAAATVQNSWIGNFAATPGSGIYVKGGVASATVIQNNVIDNGDDSGRCVWVQSSSPTITNNTLTNCDRGVYALYTSSPTVTANVITANDHGIYVRGTETSGSYTPQPIVTGNQIFANDTTNYYADNFATGAQNVKLNATGNWWGSTSVPVIASKITDLTDTPTLTDVPLVDYSGFLDGPGGSPLGNHLIGHLPTTALSSNTTYEVLGMTYVAAGTTLTVPAGATLKFYPSTGQLIVRGTLLVQGTSSNRVAFRSGEQFVAPGNWPGIRIESPSSGSIIDFAIVEHVTRAIELVNANALIRDSIIRSFDDVGIYATGATSATEIRRNYIENYTKVRTGISLVSASPIIDSNRIHRTDVAIRISGNSTPQITNNLISDNDNGINIVGDGSNSATSNPRPTINGNDMYGNTNYQLQVTGYGASSPIVINATGNWWGTATPVAGTHVKFTNAPASTLNFSSPAAGPLGAAGLVALAVSLDYFSPNGDAVQDVTTFSATLSYAAPWTVYVRDPAQQVVRTFSGSGTSISAAWDGRDSSSTVQPDGTYAFEVTVTGPSGPQIAAFRRTTLDNTPPQLTITAPAAGATLVNATSVSVSGTVGDPFLVSYTLEYGAGASPTAWTAIASATTPVTAASLGTWTTNASNGSVALTGLQSLRLRASDLAGNAPQLVQQVTLDNVVGAGITQNVAQIRPRLGEQLTVNFSLSAPATAYLRIYPDLGGAMVREVSQNFTSGGAKSLSWDGRDASNAFVADEAYRYVLYVSDGVRASTYDPPDNDNVGSGSGTVPTSFNAHRNKFWKMNYSLSDAKARVRMQVTGCTSGTHYPYNWVPFVGGTHPLMWNGRDADGALVSGTCSIYFDPPNPLRPFSVIVKGVTPTITGPGASPNVEVTSNPWKVTHSYEQISRITYRIDQDSYVTVKVLPPGITDPASPQAITLVNNEYQVAASPLDKIVEWKGYQDADTNDITAANEGTYTFAIQATSATTGATALYRGALQMRQ